MEGDVGVLTGDVGVRVVRRSENPGVPVLFDVHNLPPLVEIGLTELPKSTGASPEMTSLGVYTGNVGDNTTLWLELIYYAC